ncbi:MAG: hypothetical protein ACKPHU_04440, partial [Planctomycetaceae bacterium]
TVLRHELGHILCYGDLDPATAGDNIMSGTILPGERRASGEYVTSSCEVSAHKDGGGNSSDRAPQELTLNRHQRFESEEMGATLIAAQHHPATVDNSDTRKVPQSVPLKTPMIRAALPRESIVFSEFMDATDLQSLDELFSELPNCF